MSGASFAAETPRLIDGLAIPAKSPASNLGRARMEIVVGPVITTVVLNPWRVT
jgi:hypothetical protein